MSVRPLPERSVFGENAGDVEDLTQIGDDLLPLVLRKAAPQLDVSFDTKWKAEEPANLSRSNVFDRVGGAGHDFRRDADVAPDVLQLAKRQPFTRRSRLPARLLPVRRGLD